ncbi:hypothetical protein [Alteromonas sp. A079]|uniref:hypothetical protein n=1 Tax=Alteromonas sp. A079 TaxID=3410268 RepID=UPI003B9FA382
MTTPLRSSFLLLLTAVFSVAAVAKSTIVWLRPPEIGMEVEGTTIVSGVQHDIMALIASQTPSFSHRFESYPLKRNWSLVRDGNTPDTVYCFYGAAYNEARSKWGYYTKPTSLALPYTIASREGALNDYVDNDGHVSLPSLFAGGKTTVVYDGIKNLWVNKVLTFAGSNNIVPMNVFGKDVFEHTLELIEKGRIDFGHVSERELSLITRDRRAMLSEYSVVELANEVRELDRILCSKNALGLTATKQLDRALDIISQDQDLSKELGSLNFSMLGYPNTRKPTYLRYWDLYFPITPAVVSVSRSDKQ